MDTKHLEDVQSVFCTFNLSLKNLLTANVIFIISLSVAATTEKSPTSAESRCCPFQTTFKRSTVYIIQKNSAHLKLRRKPLMALLLYG